MNRRLPASPFRWIAVPLACLAAAALLVLPSRGTNADDRTVDVSFAPFDELSVPAGLTAEVPLSSNSQSGTAAVTVASAAGSESVAVPIEGGVGIIGIGPPHTVRSGLVSVITASGDIRSVLVTPETGTSSMDINVGPTTISSDGNTMAVGLLTDQWGNPVSNGSSVQLTVSSDGRDNQLTELRTRLGLAVVELSDASLDSDRFQLAMSGDGAFSPVVTVRVQPGTPQTFELLLENRSSLRADGRTRVNLSSTSLADADGQPLSDGTHVVLELSSPDGLSLVSGETIGGSIVASFIAPDLPGEVTVTAIVAGRSAPPLTLRFDPAVSSAPVGLEVVNGVRHLTVGPVTGPDGGVLPDGTPVVIGEVTVGLVNGEASVAIATGAPIPPVTVLGVGGDLS